MQDMMLKRENPQALTTGDNSAIIMTKKNNIKVLKERYRKRKQSAFSVEEHYNES